MTHHSPMVRDMTRSYREALLEALKDPWEANAYIEAALAEEDAEGVEMALRDIREAGHGKN